MPRTYRLGRRQASVDRTATSVVRAARELIAERGTRGVTVAAIASRAGVSRLTVYGRFGSKANLLAAIAPVATWTVTGDLRQHLEQTTAAWAQEPALYRNLPPGATRSTEAPRLIAERLAADDRLRPGCSLKEAEDVIAAVSSFATFDQLYKDGRRSGAAVIEILMRLASSILA